MAVKLRRIKPRDVAVDLRGFLHSQRTIGAGSVSGHVGLACRARLSAKPNRCVRHCVRPQMAAVPRLTGEVRPGSPSAKILSGRKDLHFLAGQSGNFVYVFVTASRQADHDDMILASLSG